MTLDRSPFARLIRFLDRRLKPATEARREIAFHLDMRARELEATGLDPAAARAEAERRFGDVAGVRRQCTRLAERRNRHTRAAAWIADARTDAAHALRQLRRAPAFAVAMIVTLALGIGVNTAVFSVVNALLFRPLPVPDPDNLYVVRTEVEGRTGGVSFLDVRDLRDTGDLADDSVAVAASVLGAVGLSRDDGVPERIAVHYVTGNLFSVLGVRAAHGRLLHPDEGWVAGDDPVAVLSWAYWQRRFGGDPETIGDPVRINGRPFTIVGVTPPALHGLNALLSIDAFLPISTLDPTYQQYAGLLDQRANRGLTGLARLAEGVSPAQAEARLDATLAGTAEVERSARPTPRTQLVAETHARPQASSAPMVATIASVFMILVTVVMLVACFNVAGLLLVRTTVRQGELAVRAALGAGRARLVRQLLTEGCVLAGLGAAAGFGIGAAVAWTLGRVNVGGDLPAHFDFSLDNRVFTFALVAAVTSAAIVGVLPALRAARGPLDPRRTTADGTSSHRLRRALVAVQIAGALLTLVTAGLFARSLHAARHADLGFRPGPVLNVSMDVGFGGAASSDRDGQAFYDLLLERVQALPGVRSAAYGHATPLGYYWLFAHPVAEGAEDVAGTLRGGPGRGDMGRTGSPRSARYNAISPGYFETLGIPLLSGRAFDDRDDANRPGVAVVNQTLAHHLWGDADALGRRFRAQQTSGPWLEVVGVVADGKYQSLLEAPRPYFYRPLAQEPHRLRVLHVHADTAPDHVAANVRGTIQALDPELPVFDLMPMRESLDGLFGTFLLRWAALLAAVFGLLGLVLAVVGVYAVVAFATASRRREIGIRLALGAERRQVVSLIVRQGLWPIVWGLAGGGLAAAMTVPRLRGLLFATAAHDAGAWLGGGLLLTAVALAAAALPAQRAAHVDPATTLRSD